MSGEESQRLDSEDCQPVSAAQPVAATLDRRTFLVQATALTSGLMVSSAVGAPVALEAPVIELKRVKEIASFLTGKSDLSDDMVSRAYSALLAEEKGFDQRLNHLVERVQAAGLADVEAFKNSSLAGDKELMSTAMAVVSALYTGRVGDGYRGHFVAYKDALMYRPIVDVSVVPTYAYFGPGYWTKEPQ